MFPKLVKDISNSLWLYCILTAFSLVPLFVGLMDIDEKGLKWVNSGLVIVGVLATLVFGAFSLVYLIQRLELHKRQIAEFEKYATEFRPDVLRELRQ